MDNWPFWMFEENIKLVNEILEDEDKDRKRQEEDQTKGMPDYGSTMKNASNMSMPNFSMPKF